MTPWIVQFRLRSGINLSSMFIFVVLQDVKIAISRSMNVDNILIYTGFVYCFRTHQGPLDLKLPVQSVPITTKFVSLNLVHDGVYSIQHYVIKFVSDFLWVLRFLSPIKLTTQYNWNSVESGIKHQKTKHTYIYRRVWT